jgi:hypothetical protein
VRGTPRRNAVSIQILGTDGNNLTSRDVDGSASNFIYINGQLKFSGNYSTGGDTLDWTTVADKLGGSQCVGIAIASQTLGNGYLPLGGPTTALNGWKVLCQTPGTFNSQLTAGAYPAGITGDTVTFSAIFRKLL